MIAVALPSRFFDDAEGLWGNLLRVLSTVIVSSLVASIGFAQDAKSEKTVRHRSIESERKEAADAIDESFRSLRKFSTVVFHLAVAGLLDCARVLASLLVGFNSLFGWLRNHAIRRRSARLAE